MTGLPRSLAQSTLLDSALAVAVLAAVVWAVSAVETGEPLGVLAAISPMVLAAATGRRTALLRARGELAGWQALGRSPIELVVPLAALAVALGLATLALPSATTITPLPAPLSADVWWSAGWGPVPDPRWLVPPDALSLPELLSRWRESVPAGARAGVDGGELLRRFAMACAWPLAVLAGIWGPATRTRAPGEGSAALLAVAWSAGWLVLAALAVGAYSMT